MNALASSSPPLRLNRSQLAVPGSQLRFFAKALHGPADVILFDLEDAVAPDAKTVARARVVEALTGDDWRARGKTVSVRINALDTPDMYRDVIDIVERAGDRIDLLMLPKAGTASDIRFLDVLLGQIEAAVGLTRRIGIEALIETATGLQNVDAIAAASPRLESLHFGAGDMAASLGMRAPVIGGAVPDNRFLTGEGPAPADPWHYGQSRLVVAARANGLRPVDGPYGDFKDGAGFDVLAGKAAAMGFEGKWCVHPDQIGAANRVFAPAAADIEQARRILDAMAAAKKQGQGAVSLDRRMIDIVSIRHAEALIAKAGLLSSMVESDL